MRPLPRVGQAVPAQVARPREGLAAFAAPVPPPQRQEAQGGGQDVGDRLMLLLLLVLLLVSGEAAVL